MNPTLRKVLRDVVSGNGWVSGTDLEDRAAQRLHLLGFRPAEVRRQLAVGPYHLDFAWPAPLKVALELDGFRHIYDPAAARRDAERDAFLRENGWLVFRVHDTENEQLFIEMLARVAHCVWGLEDLPSAGYRRRQSSRR